MQCGSVGTAVVQGLHRNTLFMDIKMYVMRAHNTADTDLSHSQLFCHSSKSCVVNFAFFAWNPFNLPRVIGWYHWNPQNRPKGALFRGYKKSRKIWLKSRKILNWPWRAHFWAHRHLSYHFGNLWTSTQEWLKGNWQKPALIITYCFL